MATITEVEPVPTKQPRMPTDNPPFTLGAIKVHAELSGDFHDVVAILHGVPPASYPCPLL